MKNFRNFVIISHIDHGKSTLADRFLELTGTVPKTKMREQFLDSMDLERGRGITIKMHPVRMEYTFDHKPYILNLIDTPGHIDFNYEVSRSLAAVEGAILLVDATKGIQAQTIHNLDLAKMQNLLIIPVVNKIDLPQAKIEETKISLAQLLKIPEGEESKLSSSPFAVARENEIFLISAKKGTNVKELLEAVIKKIPCPRGNIEKPFRALVFDSKYDPYKGIVAFIRVIDGKIELGSKIYLIQSKSEGEVKELGYFKPEFQPVKELKSGEIGYLATGIKEPGKIRVGDTITSYSVTQPLSHLVEPLPGYKVPKPVVFASIYPENPDDFENLKEALSRLKLNDSSFTFEPETKEALGRGFRCGFLGSLHTEIVSERLKSEFGLNLIISTPSVVFKIIDQKNKEFLVFSPSDWPNPAEIKEAQEPWAKLEIITPSQYLGRVLGILNNLKGKAIETKYFGTDKILLIYEVPFKEIISGFYDNLKGVSQGFASMNYEILGYKKGDLVRLEILIAGRKEEAFSKIVYKDEAHKNGKKIAEKLKEVLPSQLFSVPIQAVVSGKVVARETISAKRKDVIAPLYGGDYTRKKKLLEKQKKGKKELKEKGRIRIPSRVFLEIFKNG
ncbi:MAG: translation elongation factor 4 [Candidatus Nealsonbacteria bacterium]|nr:translation elongation factor 4 [Candidatus Nealsonbacteria bacterium]